MALNGIDISGWQRGLDLTNISYDFVGIKATEGTNYVNADCDYWFQQAKNAGKKIWIYHFFDFGVDPVAQANFFVDNCAGYIREAIFVLDWEGSGVADTNAALAFLRQVESRIGYKPAIYMSEYVENAYDWSSAVAGDYGLIAAKYSDYEIDNNYDMSGAGNPPNVTHWPFYFMWQWTSKGHLNGYAGDLDCDIAYLDNTGWDAYAGVSQPAVTQPAPQPDPTPAPAPQVADPAPVIAPEPTPTPVTDNQEPIQTPVETPVIPEPTIDPSPAAETPVATPKPSLLAVILTNILKFLTFIWNYELKK
jgi:GH25 family lysozyme M1 (1,4-beta-N-acetylmuramidase)